MTDHCTVRHDAPLASPQVRGAPCRASRRTSSCVMTHHTLTAFSALIPNLISVVSSTIDHETIPRSSPDHSSHPMTDSLAISLVIFIEFDFDHRFLCKRVRTLITRACIQYTTMIRPSNRSDRSDTTEGELTRPRARAADCGPGPYPQNPRSRLDYEGTMHKRDSQLPVQN